MNIALAILCFTLAAFNVYSATKNPQDSSILWAAAVFCFGGGLTILAIDLKS
jgi:hypothetical protein